MISHLHVLFQDQEAQYNLLLSLQAELLSYIKDGVASRDVYQHALNFIKEKKPDLEKCFVKNIGFSVRTLRQSSFSASHTFQTGIEFRDAAYLLSSRNSRLLRKNMILNLSHGFTNLTDQSGKPSVN